MVNHFRTVLLNQLESEEYVSSDFKPIEIPEECLETYNTMFSEDKELTLKRLLYLLHATELEEFVYELDSRVTYLPFENSLEKQNSLTDLYHSLVTKQHIFLKDLPNREPYTTFINLWQYHPYILHRLAGLVLALGYYLNLKHHELHQL